MAQNLFLLVSMVMVCLAATVQGTSHLMFLNTSQEVSVTRDGCGATKLCVEVPDNCNPAMATGDCLFGSILAGTSMAPDGTELNITLRGETVGYVAIGLTPAMGETMVFICGQLNGTTRFFTRQMSNDSLTPTERQVKNILINSNGSVVKCEFTVPNVNATQTRASDTTFNVTLGTGMLDSNGLGPFMIATATGLVNVANPSSNLNATAVPTTTDGAAFTSPASLLLWSGLAWAAVLTM